MAQAPPPPPPLIPDQALVCKHGGQKVCEPIVEWEWQIAVKEIEKRMENSRVIAII